MTPLQLEVLEKTRAAILASKNTPEAIEKVKECTTLLHSFGTEVISPQEEKDAERVRKQREALEKEGARIASSHKAKPPKVPKRVKRAKQDL
jgi:hypothetical protein